MNNPQWVTELFASIDSMNTDKFATYLTDDSAFTFGNSPSAVGKETVHNVVEGFFQSIKSVEHTDLQTIGSGDFIVVRGNSKYTSHNDSTLTVPFCNVFGMQGELIKDYRIYIDLSLLYA